MNNKSAEGILDKYYSPKMHWKTVNRQNVLKAMEEYRQTSKESIDELPNLAKSTENLSKIKNKDEWLNEVRGKDGLEEKFDSVIVYGINLSEQQKKQCAQIAKQYSDSKLEELEKWIDEEIEKIPTSAINGNYTVNSFNHLKLKIQSLKQ
jgi:flagellar biosynthesis GTPase FlhF